MTTLKEHTSIGEMARECAEHKGSMIVDIDRRADGTEHVHAVATWEDDEPPVGRSCPVANRLCSDAACVRGCQWTGGSGPHL